MIKKSMGAGWLERLGAGFAGGGRLGALVLLAVLAATPAWSMADTAEAGPGLSAAGERFAARLAAAWRAGQPLPLLASMGAAEPTVAEAYAIQRSLVGLLQTGPPAGFKAGLTQPQAWQAFELSEPVAGVLPAEGLLRADADGVVRIDRGAFVQPMLEIELGFRLGRAVTAPIGSAANLREQAMKGELLAEVVPVVEFPDLGFAERESLRGVDVIAANVAARQYLAGPPLPASMIANLNGLAVSLMQDGQFLLEARADNVMGDQWRALMWLINHSLAQGWELRPGQLLITGAIGPMLPLHTGCYQAQWGELETLRFCAEPD